MGTSVGALLLVVLYFCPTIVAGFRSRALGSGVAQVLVVNVLTGWTVIGWIIALVMSLRSGSDRRAARYGAS